MATGNGKLAKHLFFNRMTRTRLTPEQIKLRDQHIAYWQWTATRQIFSGVKLLEFSPLQTAVLKRFIQDGGHFLNEGLRHHLPEELRSLPVTSSTAGLHRFSSAYKHLTLCKIVKSILLIFLLVAWIIITYAIVKHLATLREFITYGLEVHVENVSSQDKQLIALSIAGILACSAYLFM